MKRIKYTLRRHKSLWLWEQLQYRIPMAVEEIHVYPCCQSEPAYPVCPKCAMAVEREYIAFCSSCGQRLDWKRFEYARVVTIEPKTEAE
ncbi:MAG: hypothetical protein HFF84_01645 [Oscillibacter sp.]|nr:hypothetical protein [Oscillibacter sp.]